LGVVRESALVVGASVVAGVSF